MIKKTTRVKGGYHLVTLCKGKGELIVSFLVSRLVAEHFIDNPDNKPQVNHKFGDKDDNRAVSLEWSTASENMRHAFDTGLRRGKQGADNISSRIVLDLKTGVFYDCVKEALKYATRYKRYQTLVDKLNGTKENDTSLIYA